MRRERANVGQGKGHANWKFPLWGRRRSLEEDRDRNLFSRNCSIMSSVSAVAWHIDQWVIIIILFVCRELDQTSRSRHDALCRQASKRESFATLLTDPYDRTEDHLYSLAMVGARPVGVLVLFCIFSIEMQRTIRIDFPTCAELINLSLRLLESGVGEDSSKCREKSSKRPKIECNFG